MSLSRETKKKEAQVKSSQVRREGQGKEVPSSPYDLRACKNRNRQTRECGSRMTAGGSSD